MLIVLLCAYLQAMYFRAGRAVAATTSVSLAQPPPLVLVGSSLRIANPPMAASGPMHVVGTMVQASAHPQIAYQLQRPPSYAPEISSNYQTPHGFVVSPPAGASQAAAAFSANGQTGNGGPLAPQMAMVALPSQAPSTSQTVQQQVVRLQSPPQIAQPNNPGSAPLPLQQASSTAAGSNLQQNLRGSPPFSTLTLPKNTNSANVSPAKSSAMQSRSSTTSEANSTSTNAGTSTNSNSAKELGKQNHTDAFDSQQQGAQISPRSPSEWNDFCEVCHDGGDLILCEGPGKPGMDSSLEHCKLVFHRACAVPLLSDDEEM